ncbi:hypothetical protein CPLU01_11988 [Colletotrichum plurivorum]|uniref:Uncharacterized protein n=1 Tax=Colletotrichum plurivorum TaxID=2175906 RepID=A0A8H6K0I1_9PEZI|nr:hypothetical protein CPLU01_11988 [Colletotrichum plurivorum]
MAYGSMSWPAPEQHTQGPNIEWSLTLSLAAVCCAIFSPVAGPCPLGLVGPASGCRPGLSLTCFRVPISPTIYDFVANSRAVSSLMDTRRERPSVRFKRLGLRIRGATPPEGPPRPLEWKRMGGAEQRERKGEQEKARTTPGDTRTHALRQVDRLTRHSRLDDGPAVRDEKEMARCKMVVSDDAFQSWVPKWVVSSVTPSILMFHRSDALAITHMAR